jgi:hypothetical protein
MLITTNWIEFPLSSQPIPALNTSLEPYIPPVKTLRQACIECHKLAVNGNKAALGMSFLPFRACPQSPRPGQKLPPNCTPGSVDTLPAHHRARAGAAPPRLGDSCMSSGGATYSRRSPSPVHASAAAVEFAVEDLLPRPEVELAGR